MNILITAPSLDPARNVNGISTVVQTIIRNNEIHTYYHYLLGRPDKKQNKFKWFIHLIRQILLFPFFLKKNKIELVHQNLPFDPKGVLREIVINGWCHLFKIQVVLHVHGGVFLMNGTSSRFFHKLSKTLLNSCQIVVVLSEVEKRALSTNYQYHTATVLNNSINSSLYSKRMRRPDTKPTLLYLGRIHQSKGVEDIIEAFHMLKKEINFRFILCGIGPLQDEFVRACREILQNDFEYLGIVSGEEKLNTIDKSSYFILPSRYGEGLPMALLETMAAGLVPIVTDDASMKYVVQHKQNGMRVAKNDPCDLYEKLKLIMCDAKLYEVLSANAAKTIAQHYDIKKYIEQLNNIYRLATTK